MLNYGCVCCKNNKERKLKFKQLKKELATKPELSIWYESNMVLYEYKTTRHELFII